MPSDAKRSLQEHCLDCIIKNFDKFMKIYNSGSGSISPKYFEFLQRAYSSALFNRLCKAYYVEDDYLAFLINPHLKQLDLRTRYFVNMHIIIERLKVMGSHIMVLDIRKKYFLEDIILELVTLVPNVEALYLSHTVSTDNVLSCISKHCASLHTLDVCYCNVTTKGIKSLCEKDKNGGVKENRVLKNLYVSSTNVGEDAIPFALAHFLALEELDLDNVGGIIFVVHEKDYLQNTLDSLRKYNLRKLNIHMNFKIGADLPQEPAIKDVLKVCSVLCPRVSCLSVDNIITQDDMLVCLDFPQLKEIKLRSSTTDLVNYAPLIQASGQSLVQIDLCNGILSAELMGKCCPNLKKLRLESINFEIVEGVMKCIPAFFPKLKFLCCKWMALTYDARESVSFLVNSSPILEVLHLQYCNYMSEAFVESLLRSKCMATLKELDLSHSNTPLPVVQKMVVATLALKHLYIENCGISDRENQDLLELFRLKSRCVDIFWKDGNDDYEDAYTILWP